MRKVKYFEIKCSAVDRFDCPYLLKVFYPKIYVLPEEERRELVARIRARKLTAEDAKYFWCTRSNPAHNWKVQYLNQRAPLTFKKKIEKIFYRDIICLRDDLEFIKFLEILRIKGALNAAVPYRFSEILHIVREPCLLDLLWIQLHCSRAFSFFNSLI